MNIEIGPPEAVATAAVHNGWFDDSNDTRLLGYGKGLVGKFLATEHLIETIKGQHGGMKMLGVYKDGMPVGLFRVEYKGEKKRSVEMHCFIAPKERGKWIFREAGTAILDRLFSQDIYRIEAEPLRINKRLIALLRHYGFKQEGIKRSAFWMDGNDYDTVMMRLLKREWKKEA